MYSPKLKSGLVSESLEARFMMAGDIDFDDGVITIDGAEFDDFAQVVFEGNRVYIDLYANDEPRDPSSTRDADHHDLDRQIADVSQIVFNGYADNDVLVIVVNDLNDGVTLDHIQLNFYGADGNDGLIHYPSSEGIRLMAWGGAGTDQFLGGPEADTLYGEGDIDMILGEGGTIGCLVAPRTISCTAEAITIFFSVRVAPIH